MNTTQGNDITRNKAIVLMVMSAILWSTGGLLIKLIPWHPMAILGARALIANIAVFSYMLYDYKKTISQENQQPFLTLNLHNILGGLSYSSLSLFFISATKLTTAANAIVLQFTAPIWIVIFSLIFFKKIPKKDDLIAVFLVMIGISLFFIDSIESGHMFGNILGVFSGISLATMVLIIKNKKTTKPIEITLIGNTISALVGIGFVFSQQFNLEIILFILFLGIFQIGIPFILYCIAIPHVSSLDAVFIPVLEPLLNPIWVFILTGEKIGSIAIFGAIIVLLTIIIHNYREAKYKELAKNYKKYPWDACSPQAHVLLDLQIFVI